MRALSFISLILIQNAEGFNCCNSKLKHLRASSSRHRAFNFPWTDFFQNNDEVKVEAGKALLVSLINKAPRNGVGSSKETVAEIESAVKSLEQFCPPQPARKTLVGIYDLLYCTAPGGSNGKVGPFVGKVTQEFLNEADFINAVELFDGKVKISLYAQREVISDKRIRVTFRQTAVQVKNVGNFVIT